MRVAGVRRLYEWFSRALGLPGRAGAAEIGSEIYPVSGVEAMR